MNAPQTKRPLHLFEGFGVELEYMIVDRDTLNVRPIADRLLADAAGEIVSDVEFDRIAWSNELALHVIELKTNGPTASLAGLAEEFHQQVGQIDSLLSNHNARLMPTAMHPWMDPHTEFELWPHEHSSIYAAYNRIFDCHGHGWANLQSMHINLPFADDAEFGRLHAAIRLLLPILPALAASSPIVEGQKTEWLDTSKCDSCFTPVSACVY
jgi:gamma-glutamyl:cysteine ligase YbdK (ATP-grasp superfamily)